VNMHRNSWTGAVFCVCGTLKFAVLRATAAVIVTHVDAAGDLHLGAVW
jgi:hypothetical protein